MNKYVAGYLRSIRALGHGSIANHITAAIDVLKYRSAETSGAACISPKANPKIARLMRSRNQEQVLAERERNDSKESTSMGIVWEQYLEAVRRQRLTFARLWDLSKAGTEVTNELAVHIQRFVALAFYACMPPSRSKEVRLLLDRVLTEKESRESRRNHITLLHGRYIAVISDFKNNKTWGQDAIELPADQQVLLKHLLWLMTPPVRQHLACAETHGYLFCKAGVEAFIHASEWTSYLSRIVEDHTGLAVGPTALRHAFTSFMETSTDDDHLRLRESVGRAMRHGPRIQQSVYNDSSLLERKRRGVEFATDHFKRAVIGIDSGNGQGAAAWAKVLRVDSGTEALMMLLRRTSPSSNTFTPDASRALQKHIATEIDWLIEGGRGHYGVDQRLYYTHQMLSIPCHKRERVLQEHLVKNPPSGFPVLAARSWKVAPPFSQLGEGDLVFASEDGARYRVVETKALNPNRERTAKTSRRKARRKVEEQVARYTKEWGQRHPNKEVSGCSFVGTTVEDAEFGRIHSRMEDDIFDRELRGLWLSEVTKGLPSQHRLLQTVR
ncbi:hypothetical protein HDU89_001141 [Geranomyces variabilis]|nr:hypothetical protein HDU89_001141 [Geranomyces variabilis]